jgi:hypothetical protein
MRMRARGTTELSRDDGREAQCEIVSMWRSLVGDEWRSDDEQRLLRRSDCRRNACRDRIDRPCG